MSAKYEAEQAEIAQRVKPLQAELDWEIDKSIGADMFKSSKYICNECMPDISRKVRISHRVTRQYP